MEGSCDLMVIHVRQEPTLSVGFHQVDLHYAEQKQETVHHHVHNEFPVR